MISHFLPAFVPTMPQVAPVFPNSYMSRECGVTQKYRFTTPSNDKVPDEVYQKLSFKSNSFKNGYFNFKLESKGKEIRVCLHFNCSQ